MLSSNFDLPPENLVTLGFGEQAPERETRRAAIRRLTDPVCAGG